MRARLVAVALAGALAILALGASRAAAADECNGLLVCLPVAGPWVMIPSGTGTSAGRADYELRCPLRGYIVAGTDVRLAHRQIDVAIRGETGSPVSPGTTTRESVLFSGLYAGGDGRPTAFRPYIGCMPTSGGGGRSQTAVAADFGFKPTRPVERRVVDRALPAGATRVVARCPSSTRLVDGGHAVAFRVDRPPAAEALAAVKTVSRIAPGAVVVTATVGVGALDSKPELQVRALCTRTVP